MWRIKTEGLYEASDALHDSYQEFFAMSEEVYMIGRRLSEISDEYDTVVRWIMKTSDRMEQEAVRTEQSSRALQAIGRDYEKHEQNIIEESETPASHFISVICNPIIQDIRFLKHLIV